MNLTAIRKILVNKKIIISVSIIILAVLSLPILFYKNQPNTEILNKTLPTSEQPVKDGKFDENTEISQKSKQQVENIKDKLPKREEFTTSAGTKIIYLIYIDEMVPYNINVATANINLEIPQENPDFPKQVLNFRETMARIYDWLDNQGVEINSVFIVWSEPSMQKASDTLLLESPQYPKVIEVNGNFQFEKEPVKETP